MARTGGNGPGGFGQVPGNGAGDLVAPGHVARGLVVETLALREIRSYVIVGSFVVAAVVTPPDVISQLLLAIPLCLLYELGLFAARFVEKRKPAPSVDAEAG